jgi:hypothetical protein
MSNRLITLTRRRRCFRTTGATSWPTAPVGNTLARPVRQHQLSLSIPNLDAAHLVQLCRPVLQGWQPGAAVVFGGARGREPGAAIFERAQ